MEKKGGWSSEEDTLLCQNMKYKTDKLPNNTDLFSHMREVYDMIEIPREEFNEPNEQLTPSLAVTGQKFDILRDLETQANTDMIRGIYLEKDDLEVIALMQQAELLSSLALKLSIKKTPQTTHNASKETAKRQEDNGNGGDGADYKLIPGGPEKKFENGK